MKIRCKGKSLTEKRGSLKYVPMLKLKTQLMSPPPTIKNTKKKQHAPPCLVQAVTKRSESVGKPTFK